MASLTNWRHFPSLLLSSQESWVILCRSSSPWASSWKPSSPLAASWPPKARPYLVSGPICRGPICLEPSELFLWSRQHDGFTNPRSRSWWCGEVAGEHFSQHLAAVALVGLSPTSCHQKPKSRIGHTWTNNLNWFDKNRNLRLDTLNQNLRLATLEPKTLNWLHMNQKLKTDLTKPEPQIG